MLLLFIYYLKPNAGTITNGKVNFTLTPLGQKTIFLIYFEILRISRLNFLY